LKSIEKEGEVELKTLAEDKHYKLKGMPFYNEAKKKQFIDIFEKEFCLAFKGKGSQKDT